MVDPKQLCVSQDVIIIQASSLIQAPWWWKNGMQIPCFPSLLAFLFLNVFCFYYCDDISRSNSSSQIKDTKLLWVRTSTAIELYTGLFVVKKWHASPLFPFLITSFISIDACSFQTMAKTFGFYLQLIVLPRWKEWARTHCRKLITEAVARNMMCECPNLWSNYIYQVSLLLWMVFYVPSKIYSSHAYLQVLI